MTLTELSARLSEMGVPEEYYSLGAERHEALCLLLEGSRWKVFLSERGVRYEERIFPREYDACEYFLVRVLQLWLP